MNVVRCENGHFYDGDKYTLCPHCGAKTCVTIETPQLTEKTTKKSSSIFGRKNKLVSTVKQQASNQDEETCALPIDNKEYGGNNTEDKHPKDHQAVNNDFADDEKTMDLWQLEEEPKCETPMSSKQDSVESSVQEQSSLRSAIQRISANNEEKTVGIFSSGRETARAEVSNPVVGWMVCVAGPHFGESFCISAGKNGVGRTNENDIVLSKDNSVSRVKHAMIIYEPKKRNFYLQPGDSSGLTYLNDEYIMDSKLLSSRDIIELGDSKFMLVPLCGPDFTWEDYLSKG